MSAQAARRLRVHLCGEDDTPWSQSSTTDEIVLATRAVTLRGALRALDFGGEGAAFDARVRRHWWRERNGERELWLAVREGE